MDDCIICQKHGDTGPLAGGVRVWDDEHVAVYHKLLDPDHKKLRTLVEEEHSLSRLSRVVASHLEDLVKRPRLL